jgi:hypothetical protein
MAFSSARGVLLHMTIVLVAATSEGWAKFTQSRDGGRHDGARTGTHRHAVDGTKMALGKVVRRRPEVCDGLTAVQLRSAREIFHSVNVQ